jgi:hypothetical protein
METSMHKLLTSLAAASAVALLASSAQAACSGHSVTASSQQVEEGVAMSTYDGAATPASTEVEEKAAEASAEPVCAEGDKNCADATK